MTNRTRSVEDGGTTGFRRLFDYGHAMSPRDLRALLDPQEEDMPHRARVGEELALKQRKSLETIDTVAAEVTLFDIRIMKARSTEDLAFACALDRPTPKARLHAMLARAYARADRFAAACADELDVKAQASTLAASLTRALAALSGPDGILWGKNPTGDELCEGSTVKRALAAYERMTWYEDRVRAERYENLRRGLEVIETVRDGLERFKGRDADGEDTGPAYGWPMGDEARFFFLLRLAEVFTISTGEVPTFNGWYARKGTYWATFAWAALSLTGLGTDNFDDLSRQLGGRKAKRRRTIFEAHYADFFKGMATWFAPGRLAGPACRESDKCAGELMTAGRAIDRHDGGEPWSWREHMI